jgi:hypothetical protein
MILIILLSLLPNFQSEFHNLKVGEPVSKTFAINYLEVDPSQYGEGENYEVRFKPEFGTSGLPALVYNYNNGTCDEDYLVIFNNDGSTRSRMKVFARCDHDLRVATYKIWSFEIEPEESLIYLSVRGKKVKDSSKIDQNGRIIGSKNILQLETESFEYLEVYAVSNDGSINQLSF